MGTIRPCCHIRFTFYNLSPEIIRIMTRQIKMFEGFIGFTILRYKEHVGDGIISNWHMPVFTNTRSMSKQTVDHTKMGTTVAGHAAT